MLRLAALIIAWALALGALAPSGWALPEAGARRSARTCDPAPELAAAKQAAAAGDPVAAVEHLLRADEILAACSPDPAVTGPAQPESPERAFAHDSGPARTLPQG